MKMDRKHLWAKSKKAHEPLVQSMILPTHLADTHDAAIQILDATGASQLVALGLDPIRFADRFRRCVLLAASFHDLGKANDHFQDMILGDRNVLQNPQGIRHEWVSVLLLREKLREWMLPAVNGSETDLDIIEWAIGGHHPAYLREAPPRRTEPRGEGPLMRVLTNHQEFYECLRLAKDRFQSLSDIPKFIDCWEVHLIGGDRVSHRIDKWLVESERLWERFTPDDKRMVAGVKTCVIAADVAASALPRLPNKTKSAAWIAAAFANTPRSGELAAIVRRRLDAKPLREFQAKIANSAALVTFAKAGCGSGKTLAAYHWAATNHSTKRLYFCYPTTGTATEGFRDYLHVAESTIEDGDDETVREVKARLFHGRAEVDMALVVRGDDKNSDADAADRIESLDAWSTPVVSCTVDTVLGLVQNVRRGIYAWPALAGAAFVFDEIHAYDDKLFGALLRFLQNLPGLPVLLMTASLPKARLEALRNCCLKRAKREPMTEVPGPEDLESLPRYHREQVPLDIAGRVREEIAAGGKVLWISNTVKRAIAAADSIGDLNPEIYHSRFRYCDRLQRHAAVIDMFKANGPAVACATQVAEMSLDLSATLLVTELAPVPALIQRLGRLNRGANPNDPTRPFIVFDVGDNHLPYTAEELEASRQWLAALPDGSMSQEDLAQVWEQHDASKKPDFMASAWLDGGPMTTVSELRKASPGITVVLQEDADKLRTGAKRLAEVALPMPPPIVRDWREWPAINGVPIASPDMIEYDRTRGAAWRG